VNGQLHNPDCLLEKPPGGGFMGEFENKKKCLRLFALLGMEPQQLGRAASS
jgi:hypothetical protein